MEVLAFSELVEINPRVGIERGKEYPFIEMGIVEPERRYVQAYENRTYKGSGAKFIVGDTLFARITPCLENGKIVQYKNTDGQPGFGSTEFFVFRARPKISDDGFVYYLAKSDLLRKPAEKSMSGTSGRQRADIKSIVDLEIPVPSLLTQRRIAAILSAYDDLIENNLRRIKILEEMAQNFYREWFVKFRFPGHEKVHFVDSSLGRVPAGWDITKISSLLEAIKRKKKIKKQVYESEGEIPIVDQGKDFIGGFTSDSEALHKKPLPIIVFGDHTRVLKFIDFPFASGAEGTQLLKSNTKRMPMSLFFYMLKSIDLSNYTYARHFKFLKDQEVLLPNQEISEAFSDFADPFREQIRSLIKQNTLLRRTRDLLLPKLISGDIDVSNLTIQTDWQRRENKNDIGRYDFFQQICRLPFVDKIVLFGSRARGNHYDRSDIDLAVFCDQASDVEWQQVLDCLDEDRIDTLLKVDCVRFERSNAALKEHIMIEGKVLYEKNGRQTIKLPQKRKRPTRMNQKKLANHLSNSQRCLQRLADAIRQPLDEDMFMLDAVVHRFNIAFELLMDTLLVYCVETDFLPKEKSREYELNARKLIELAFAGKLIDDDQTWIAIKNARNATAHEYDEQQAIDHYNKVKSYLPHLQALFEKMNTIHSTTPADDVAKDASSRSKDSAADG